MSKPTPLAVTVSRAIDATPERLYDLVSDVTNMGSFSPETRSCEWIVRGAKFKGVNKIGKLRWATKPSVTVAERGRTFAFEVPGKSGPEWTYRFEPAGSGTLVTESMRQAAPSPAIVRFLRRRAGVVDRAEHLRAGMQTTLDRLAAAAGSH